MTAAGPLAGTRTPAADSASAATSPMDNVPGLPVKQAGAQLSAAFPPRPVASSWPATEASRAAVLARVLSPPFALDNPLSQQTRRLGVLAVLSWLRTLVRCQLAAAMAGQRRRGPARLARPAQCRLRRSRPVHDDRRGTAPASGPGPAGADLR